MSFVHDDPDFPLLLDAVAAAGPLRAPALVEKDYWVTHALWAIQQSGFALWFKGGTSLTKAFQLTSRFSEDLDLVMLAGDVAGLPSVTSWRGSTTTAVTSREQYWRAVEGHLRVPGATVVLVPDDDETYINPKFRVTYEGHHLTHLRTPSSIIKPYVLLELAHADDHCAIAPSVDVPVTSFVHEYLRAEGQWDARITDNRATSVACVHPIVTLIEKLDAITRRYDRPDGRFAPATFARHYEDAARIILAADRLPTLGMTPAALAADMHARGLIRQIVTNTHPAFTLEDAQRRTAIEQAYGALSNMYWVPQMPLVATCEAIRGWVGSALARKD